MSHGGTFRFRLCRDAVGERVPIENPNDNEVNDPGNGAVPEQTAPELPWVHAMRQQAVNFVQAIKGGETPLCQAPEAMEDLQIAHDYVVALKGDLSL